MENNKLVTIIIPVFNVAPYLKEALESAVRQTYNNLEIIVIDDGSTDGSAEICDAFAQKDTRIIVVHQKNRGLSAARNVGLDRMTGDVVAFLDSDDALEPTFVEIMISKQNQNEADLVICKYTNQHINTRMEQHDTDIVLPNIEQGLYDQNTSLRSLAAETINYGVWNKLYKKDCWHGIRFPEGHVYEDIDTTYRIIYSCEKVCVVNIPLYMHRMRVGSIIDSNTKQNIEDYLLACSHFESFIVENIPAVFTREELERVIQNRLNRMIGFYLRYIKNNKCDSYSEELRQRISKTEKMVGIGLPDSRRKTILWMMRKCPWLLHLIYPMYYSFHQI